jgi:hypothetical protein
MGRGREARQGEARLPHDGGRSLSRYVSKRVREVKMTNGSKIIAGLQDAIAHARGDAHEVEVAERSRTLRRALNTARTAPDLIDVMVRLETAQRALRAANKAVPADRPAIRERIAEIEDAVENCIDGLK